jgi:hypothetical protein
LPASGGRVRVASTDARSPDRLGRRPRLRSRRTGKARTIKVKLVVIAQDNLGIHTRLSQTFKVKR